MKITRTFLLIASFAVSTGVAQQPVADPSASVYETPGLLRAVAPKQPKDEAKRINGLSTRSWTTVVDWHPGASAFQDEITHEPGLYVFSVGAGPER